MGSTTTARRLRRVTSVDVASEAGVSQATVARVFSSPELVSDVTRDRVQAIATQLGYTPNAIARGLKQQRTDIIGAVVPAYGEYWQHVLTAFSRQLAEVGKQLLLFSFPDGGNVDGVLATVDQFRVDGLLLASANISPAHLSRVWSSGLPVVAFNQPAASGLAPSVSVDHQAGMEQLVDHVMDAGATSALFVGGDSTASTDQLRYRGAAQRLADHGVACPYVEAGAFSYGAGHRIVDELLARPSIPDALFVAGDELAFGVVDGLRRLGRSVPEDVFVTGFDGLPQAAWAGYDLTTVVQPTETLVQAAVALLTGDADEAGDADAGSRSDVPDHVVPGSLRVGATTQHTRTESTGA